MDWRYYWRRHLGWLPIQFCMNCGRWYWAGLPWPEWHQGIGGRREWSGWYWPWYTEYCSQECCDEELSWDYWIGDEQ